MTWIGRVDGQDPDWIQVRNNTSCQQDYIFYVTIHETITEAMVSFRMGQSCMTGLCSCAHRIEGTVSQMEPSRVLMDFMQRGDYLAMVDIRDAYLADSIHPRDQDCQGIFWDFRRTFCRRIYDTINAVAKLHFKFDCWGASTRIGNGGWLSSESSTGRQRSLADTAHLYQRTVMLQERVLAPSMQGTGGWEPLRKGWTVRSESGWATIIPLLMTPAREPTLMSWRCGQRFVRLRLGVTCGATARWSWSQTMRQSEQH